LTGRSAQFGYTGTPFVPSVYKTEAYNKIVQEQRQRSPHGGPTIVRGFNPLDLTAPKHEAEGKRVRGEGGLEVTLIFGSKRRWDRTVSQGKLDELVHGTGNLA
jgi:hypothetical protein